MCPGYAIENPCATSLCCENPACTSARKTFGREMPYQTLLAWSIIIPATAGVIVRPYRLPEAIWAMAGAAALVLAGLLPLGDALVGMRKGIDVYLFLIGMMLI